MGTVSGGIHSAGLVGSLVGSNPNVIENCHVSTAVTCTGYGDSKAHGGGIVGHAHSTTATITGCQFDGSITHNQSSNSGTYAGAIVGWSDDATRITVRNCIENGSYTKFANEGFGYEVKTDEVTFSGLFSPYAISGEDRSLLYLGGDNQLYWPNAAMTIGACRALFYLADDITAGEPKEQGGSQSDNIRAFVLNFFDEQSGGAERGDGEQTGIAEAVANSSLFTSAVVLPRRPPSAGPAHTTRHLRQRWKESSNKVKNHEQKL